MTNAANVVPISKERTPGVRNARVLSVSGGAVEIEMGERAMKAGVAFSCLVQPRAGDLVICSEDDSGRYYVLGIIERPGDQNLTVRFPADASMVASRGSMNFMSTGSTTMASGEGLNFISDRAVHTSREAVVDFGELKARGSDLKADFKSALVMFGMINTMATRAIGRFKSFVRHTEDYDQVKAGQMTRKVAGLYSMDSKNTIMVSRKDTKIDGERIFMA